MFKRWSIAVDVAVGMVAVVGGSISQYQYNLMKMTTATISKPTTTTPCVIVLSLLRRALVAAIVVCTHTSRYLHECMPTKLRWDVGKYIQIHIVQMRMFTFYCSMVTVTRTICVSFCNECNDENSEIL